MTIPTKKTISIAIPVSPISKFFATAGAIPRAVNPPHPVGFCSTVKKSTIKPITRRKNKIPHPIKTFFNDNEDEAPLFICTFLFT